MFYKEKAMVGGEERLQRELLNPLGAFIFGRSGKSIS
jgi:hypothetical protein